MVLEVDNNNWKCCYMKDQFLFFCKQFALFQRSTNQALFFTSTKNSFFPTSIQNLVLFYFISVSPEQYIFVLYFLVDTWSEHFLMNNLNICISFLKISLFISALNFYGIIFLFLLCFFFWGGREYTLQRYSEVNLDSVLRD